MQTRILCLTVLAATALCVWANQDFSHLEGRDPYDVLGVERGADVAVVKKAYRKLAVQWHPDKNPNNVEVAKIKFIEIKTAYEILVDPSVREEYEKFSSEWPCRFKYTSVTEWKLVCDWDELSNEDREFLQQMLVFGSAFIVISVILVFAACACCRSRRRNKERQSADSAAKAIAPAPMLLRLAALLIDFGVVIVIFIIREATKGNPDSSEVDADPRIFAIPFIFEALSLYLWSGYTPGHWVFGMHVVEASEGVVLPGVSLFKALARTTLKWASVPLALAVIMLGSGVSLDEETNPDEQEPNLLVLAGIGFATFRILRHGRSVHDRLVGTQVVRGHSAPVDKDD